MMIDLAKIIAAMDMTLSEVMVEARISSEALQQAISGKPPDRKIQLKLEAVLDQAIWATPEQFKERRNLRKFVGAEPLILTTEQLLGRARVLGVGAISKGCASKDKLIMAIADLVKTITLDGEPVLAHGRLLRCRACAEIFQTQTPANCPFCGSLRICPAGG